MPSSNNVALSYVIVHASCAAQSLWDIQSKDSAEKPAHNVNGFTKHKHTCTIHTCGKRMIGGKRPKKRQSEQYTNAIVRIH